MTFVVTLDSRLFWKLALILLIVGAVVYFRYNPDDLEAVKAVMRKWYLLP